MSTIGYEAEPGEVQALLDNLCGEILAESDPLVRYTMLTKEQALFDALVSAIKRKRGDALAEMVDAGATQESLTSSTGLGTRQRVAQLIAGRGDRRAGTTKPAACG